MVESNKLQEQETFHPIRITAERVLSTALGHQVHINEMERLTEAGRRNLLLRCHIDRILNLPSSFILKKVETVNMQMPVPITFWIRGKACD